MRCLVLVLSMVLFCFSLSANSEEILKCDSYDSVRIGELEVEPKGLAHIKAMEENPPSDIGYAFSPTQKFSEFGHIFCQDVYYASRSVRYKTEVGYIDGFYYKIDYRWGDVSTDRHEALGARKVDWNIDCGKEDGELFCSIKKVTFNRFLLTVRMVKGESAVVLGSGDHLPGTSMTLRANRYLAISNQAPWFTSDQSSEIVSWLREDMQVRAGYTKEGFGLSESVFDTRGFELAEQIALWILGHGDDWKEPYFVFCVPVKERPGLEYCF